MKQMSEQNKNMTLVFISSVYLFDTASSEINQGAWK